MSPPHAPRHWYARPPEELALLLLGQRFVRTLDDGTRLAGEIVETEAYLGREDRAAHSFGGRRTARNEAMYARPGTLYVYFTYGMHHCMNVVCGGVDEPVAVLIRALAPCDGRDQMRSHRQAGRKTDKPLSDRDLCSGPGKVCQALALDRSHSGLDLVSSGAVSIELARQQPFRPGDVVNTHRIGVDSAGQEWATRPLRWFIAESAHVSAHRRSMHSI